MLAQCWLNAGHRLRQISQNMFLPGCASVAAALKKNVNFNLDFWCKSRKRDLEPILVYCRTTVFDAGPVLSNHWTKVSCLLIKKRHTHFQSGMTHGFTLSQKDILTFVCVWTTFTWIWTTFYPSSACQRLSFECVWSLILCVWTTFVQMWTTFQGSRNVPTTFPSLAFTLFSNRKPPDREVNQLVADSEIPDCI